MTNRKGHSGPITCNHVRRVAQDARGKLQTIGWGWDAELSAHDLILAVQEEAREQFDEASSAREKGFHNRADFHLGQYAALTYAIRELVAAYAKHHCEGHCSQAEEVDEGVVQVASVEHAMEKLRRGEAIAGTVVRAPSEPYIPLPQVVLPRSSGVRAPRRTQTRRRTLRRGCRSSAAGRDGPDEPEPPEGRLHTVLRLGPYTYIHDYVVARRIARKVFGQ